MTTMPPTIMTGPKEKATNPCMLCGVNGTLDLEDSMICEACGYATLPTSEKTTSHHSKFLESYAQHVQERASMAHGFGVAPKPLSPAQVQALLEEFQSDACSAQERETLLQLLSYRVPPGVDQAAQYKAEFLSAIAKQDKNHPNLSQMQAIELLGTMLGGYNVKPLVDLLNHDDYSVASAAAQQLKYTLLIFDAFESIEELHKSGCQAATAVLESWAAAEWFLEKPKVPNKITITVFKVQGETNTDDLSPAPNAWSRPDIPLHATCMLKNPRDGIHPVEQGEVGPLAQIEDLREKGFPLAYVGDVVGTGSSRKSATNSVLWFMGEEIPHVPNIKRGGICIGGKIAPIFFNTMQDSGALPIEMDVSKLSMGDVVDIYPYDGRVCRNNSDEVLATFSLKSPVLLDEVRAGGRIPLIIGRSLTAKARESLGRNAALDDVFCSPPGPDHIPGGWTLAQKMVGKACGLEGVAPGQYCEPRITTVGSQDTTGPMTRDELKSLACLKFSAGLVMQSFCHTAAYPKKVDLAMHRTLPKFFCSRGGVALKPGDGIIHSWLNRMILPDTVGTGGDSHTRFPIGVSFPSGSGLVAFAAATGMMPLEMPESVLVRFTGNMQPGITLRDLVQAIPYTAIRMGLLTVEKANKRNIFSGRILEIEGLSHLSCEQAFELAAASAERSAAGCTIKLDEEPVVEYVRSNVAFLKQLILQGYGDADTLRKRLVSMEDWLSNPVLLEADPNAEYAAVIEINLDELNEPVLALPNDPDACALLSEVQGTPIDEGFIGSCMTNIGHFRAVGKLLEDVPKQCPVRLWMTPPTRMDEHQLRQEGYFSIFGASGARTEIPGCSLCMGNQARVVDSATVVSTSTRNFPNRLGQGANVYLASAELVAIASIEGKLPTVERYRKYMEGITPTAADSYRYLRFDQMDDLEEN